MTKKSSAELISDWINAAEAKGMTARAIESSVFYGTEGDGPFTVSLKAISWGKGESFSTNTSYGSQAVNLNTINETEEQKYLKMVQIERVINSYWNDRRTTDSAIVEIRKILDSDIDASGVNLKPCLACWEEPPCKP